MSSLHTQPAFTLSEVRKVFAVPQEQRQDLRSRFLRILHPNPTREFIAVDGVTLTIARGEFFGIIGRNGSGKSTLLKMLTGIYLPTSGQLDVHGRVSPFLELGLGFHPELTARENIYLNGAVLGMDHEEIVEREKAILSFAELEDFQQVKVKNFSSGMYVRLAFSVAIHAPSDILLMDEVLAVGDERFQEKCMAVFEDLKRRGKTVILVSHDMASIERFCDRVLVMEAGKPLCICPPKEATEAYHHLNSPLRNMQEELTQMENMQEASSLLPTSPISIDKVAYSSGDDAWTGRISSGRPLRVTIDYSCTEELSPTHCGVALLKEDGTYVFGTNTILDHAPLEPGKKGRMTLTYAALPLPAGTYRTSVALFGASDSEVLAVETETPRLTVTHPIAYEGACVLSHSWTHTLL